MSDFVSHDMLTDLWDEILKRLWNYLETEESVQKLEERKKLETCLKEFLCIVPHDRKFFLPETTEVLGKTVRELENFTANKAIIAFESIFQYASNLFTKPWRKEYRVLKMYSGFYQHEVRSNLVDAIKLFEDMGYRQLNDDILVLDGPICPDQMANVSRDAMAAYVECQIMKQIYLGLETLNLDCTWQDVYNFREKQTGSTSDAIKNLAYAMQEKKLRKDKNSTLDNFYSSVSSTLHHLPQLPTTANAHYPNCTSYAHTHTSSNHSVSQQQQQQKLSAHYTSNNGVCAMHPSQTVSNLQQQCNIHAPNGACVAYNNNINGKLMGSYPATVGSYVQHHQDYAGAGVQPHMSHSRSLEQYNDPPALTPHRHSFDHQACMATHHYQQPVYAGQMHVYESTYDCVDSTAGSNASYAMVAASPYNVSGNRYPLPYSISSQLNAHYATPATVTCNGIKGEPYSTNNADNLYATVSKNTTCNMHHQQQQPPQLPPPPSSSLNRCAGSGTPNKDFHSYRQLSFPPDQHLIDFDDREPLTSHDYHAHLHTITQNNSFDSSYEKASRQSRRAANRMAANYAQPRDLVCARATTPNSCTSSQDVAVNSNEIHDKYGYERPVTRSSRNKTTTEQYARNVQESMDNNIKLQHASSLKAYNEDMLRRKSADLLNTYDDFSEKVRVSPTQAVKNQDGVGSFESWDFVYQNLERSGYTKDLGERGDLLVQSLDLNAFQLGSNQNNNATVTSGTSSGEAIAEKRRVTELKAGRQNLEKLRTLEKNPKASDEQCRDENVNKKHVPTTNGLSKKAHTKSSLKAMPTAAAIQITPTSTTTTTAAIETQKNSNNNNNNNELLLVAGKDVRRVPELSKRSPRIIQKVPTPIATQVIVSSPNEWSCRFCTFLNPDTKRVCEMCCRSKDFNLETTASHAPTCV